MSMSPKHIRVPKPKKDHEVRHLTRSQLASIENKRGKNLKLFSLPLEKDYFNKKIKTTVKHYFQARRSTISNNFNTGDIAKEKKTVNEETRADKNHRVIIELDPSCDISEKPTQYKLSSKVTPLPTAFSPKTYRENSPQLEALEKDSKNSQRNEKYKKTEVVLLRPSRQKVDQGLQTEEFLMNNLVLSVQAD